MIIDHLYHDPPKSIFYKDNRLTRYDFNNLAKMGRKLILGKKRKKGLLGAQGILVDYNCIRS
jgi:hypothetical protein